jgi:PTH1 family peptidyl-tRNA hydrolase
MSISLVAGLGNPGREYADSRHNFGWMVTEGLAKRHRLAWRSSFRFQAEVARWDRPSHPVWLVKPLTFMNDSGVAVGGLMRFHKLEPSQIAAAYDDLTLDFGTLKLTQSGSAGGHNGVASLLEHVGDGFARFRFGIGPKLPREMDLKDFVLGKFPPEQYLHLQNNLENIIDALELLLNQGTTRAMNQINRRNPT